MQLANLDCGTLQDKIPGFFNKWISRTKQDSWENYRLKKKDLKTYKQWQFKELVWSPIQTNKELLKKKNENFKNSQDIWWY